MENTNKINPLDNGNDSLTHYNYNLIKATTNNLHYHINATASRYATISTMTNNSQQLCIDHHNRRVVQQPRRECDTRRNMMWSSP